MTRLFLLSLLVSTAAAAQTPQMPAPQMPAEASQADIDAFGAALGTQRTPIREVGILVYDGVNDLDVFGPRSVLGAMFVTTRTRLVSVDPGTVRTAMGVTVVPDAIIADVDSLDLLVVPGGGTETIEAMYDARVQDWIRRIDRTTTYTTAVCNGGWILAATGLLEGRRAATNWHRGGEMMARYGATFTGERYSHDGKYWTSAGVTAGMDMSLALLQDIYGDAFTQAVMLDMEYAPQPPVAGGTPATTPAPVLDFMEAMYDSGFAPVFERLDPDHPLSPLHTASGD